MIALQPIHRHHLLIHQIIININLENRTFHSTNPFNRYAIASEWIDFVHILGEHW